MFGNVSNAISNCFKESSDLLNLVKSDIELQRALEDSCKLCIEAYKKNSKILIAGNGGSAADAATGPEVVSRVGGGGRRGALAERRQRSSGPGRHRPNG